MRMVDLTTEARTAVKAALEMALGTDWPVFDTVPQGTAPNFVMIGAVDTEDKSDQWVQMEQLTVDIAGIYRGQNRDVLGAMTFAARAALDWQTLVTAKATFQCRFASGSISEAQQDGITYGSLTTFTLLGQPT